ncbi:MAG: bifunctional aspartate kinase/homoserine dehydrogenase I [Bacteroidales bacterium]
MKVLKFGGTSVGSVESIKNVKRIVEARTEESIVVVSALGGITDKLIECAKTASRGEQSYADIMKAIAARHYVEIDEALAPEIRPEVTANVNALLDELGNIMRGVSLIKDLSEKTLGTILSYGERLSSYIISNLISEAKLYDSREFIKTEQQYGKNIVDFKTTSELVRKTFAVLPKVAVVSGFISSDKNSNDITNLGRGGSDYTAAILASVLNADKLEIWTDVDGFMTADPKTIKTSYVIKHLSFVEAMELCNFGAKVIFPPTIYPVYHKNIPIVIKNTFNPDAPGTLITKQVPDGEAKAIKGISSINDTCLVTVSGLGMVGVIGINSRIFNALAKSGVSVFLVSQGASENNISFAVRNGDADLAVSVLNNEFAQEIAMGEICEAQAEHDLATVAIVGENMKHTPGIAGKLFNILGRNGISVIACAQGASETNISFVVELDSLRKALNVIHDSFFLSDAQELNLFITGIGTVGKDLLQQIKLQQPNLLLDKSLKLNIVGLANSRKCVFSRDGISLENYSELLENSPLKASAVIIRDEIIKMNIFNSVFVDCTASADIAGIYQTLLDHNVSVVAANKIAASSPYANYSALKQTARKRDIKYLFETNVGAGLPIISTINGLINSGDKILRIEAVVSGTLNYIFSTLSEDIPLSKAILMAKEAGYSEPDPRLDLNGQDVIRKLVILARESGYQVEQSDVQKNLFIPCGMFSGSIDEFWRDIPKLDAEFESRRREVAAQGRRLRFIATLNNGEMSVGLQAVDSRHPFFQLEGSNNVILITTERYKEYPMVIKGYGAGASVTAAGVFADIISIANIR